MPRVEFDDLIAKKAQRDKDKLAVKEIHIPSMGKSLLFKKPDDSIMLELIGMMAECNNASDIIPVIDKAMYFCCEQLQDTSLHNAIGVADPDDVVPTLFEPTERDAIGSELLLFLGLMTIPKSEEESEIKNS